MIRGLRAGHTHAGGINKDLLRSRGRVIQVERTLVDVEGSKLLLRTVTGSILVLKAGENAALGGIEGGILHTAAGVDGDDAEGLAGGGVRGRKSGGGGGSEEKVLELHFDDGLRSI